MIVPYRRAKASLFCQLCCNKGESYSIHNVRVHNNLKIGLDVESNPMEGVKLHDELKIGLDVDNNSMEGVKLHDESNIGLDVVSNSMEGVKLHDELKIGLDVDNNSMEGVKLHDESNIGLDVVSNSMEGVKLHDELKIGLDVDNNSMEGVKLHDESNIGLDVVSNSMEGVKLHDELKIGLDVDNNSMEGVKLHDDSNIGLDVVSNSMEGVKLHDELKLILAAKDNSMDSELKSGLDVEWFDKSSTQDSNESNLSYKGSEQHLFEGLDRNSGAGERKDPDKGMELEHSFDRDGSSLTRLELAPYEEDEVNSIIFDWESQLCLPLDNLFDVLDTYPSLLDNRIPKTENLFSSDVGHNSRPRISVNGTPFDNRIDVVPKTYERKNFRDNLPFKVCKKRRSSKLTKLERINVRKSNIYSTKKRQCSHCKSEKTPQWREGPLGPKTLCNACGVRYKKGRLVAEYRPLASPTFDPKRHSNRDRKIVRRMINPVIPTFDPKRHSNRDRKIVRRMINPVM